MQQVEEEKPFQDMKKVYVSLLVLMFLLLALVMFASTLHAAPRGVEKERVCENKQEGIKRWIAKFLKRTGYGRSKTRTLISSKLSERIDAEATRFGLDPLVMTTIAWIESDYRPFLRGAFGGAGRRRNEVGVWQLIPGDFAIRQANKEILGCPLSPKASKFQKWAWNRKYKGKACKYPDVGSKRMTCGRFSRSELGDFYIGTFLAAYEMKKHVDACAKRKPHGHRWSKPGWFRKWQKRNPRVDVTALERYLHFNWGSRQFPNSPYRYRLFRRYSRVRTEVCRRHTATVALAK